MRVAWELADWALLQVAVYLLIQNKDGVSVDGE